MSNSGVAKNIFADRATLIIRKMLARPEKKWVIRDFTGPEGVSMGLAQKVMEAMARKGYLERVKAGPLSYAVLANQENLVKDWLSGYSFEMNKEEIYFSHDKNVLNGLKKILKDKQYALTLHTGANLLTGYVRTDHVYLYLLSTDWQGDILDLRQRLDLKELVNGGNIHIIRPLYEKGMFFNLQKIKGYPVVSNLQLYLDLFQYKPRGREHADYLQNILADKGISIYGS